VSRIVTYSTAREAWLTTKEDCKQLN